MTDTTRPARCPFRPYEAAVDHTTDAAYARMRASEPVHKLEGRNVYLLTRYDDVMDAVRDIETFSNEFVSPGLALGEGSPEIGGEIASIKANGFPQVSTMLTRDPPAHDRFRRLTTRAFTPRRVSSWQPEIERIIAELIDDLIDRGEVEFVSAFAVPLPVRVIAHALGVPRTHEIDFKAWTDHATSSIGADPGDEGRLAAARGLVEFQHYFASELEDRRTSPRDDFLTDLLNAEILAEDGIEDTRALDTPEMLSILHQLLVAGNETTTALLASAVIELSDKPDVCRAVAEDRDVARNVVEEVLRLASPAQGMFRIVKRPVRIGGVDIAEGATAILMYASANRDESRFENPDRFIVDRADRQHLAFGHGTHFCVGARLSRLESELALMELCRRGEFELVADPTWKPSFVLSGPETVTIRFSSR